ncbi:MAG: hypothetical protein F2925_02855 [Actinobacteria bacterium]|nr:hypothetical protein [Actinomycetota bacterium]MSX45129.1 hypothetical protein [Actinomycetota bacterium]MSX73040.1 hypothetical protein [Actinomycetota bacterium]MSZ00750.1 hypothetical protein [Actinomycetota bacterium]MTB20414.1 hypothetical protein [Actinomycetota bacterium]
MIQHFNNPLATNFLSVDHPLSDSYADLELGSVAYLLDAEMATLLLMAVPTNQVHRRRDLIF